MGRLVAALGIAQIISWGTLFYAIGVLGKAMRRDLGVSELFLFSAFTAGLLVSGALAPVAGRLIDRRGGRPALSLGSILGAAAMATLSLAPNATVLVMGWLVAGAAMAFCLYDPAFATLSQVAGERYRRAVTALTLFGGFASTAFWPLSLLLLESVDWRATCQIYAALHLAVCLPIHWAFIPQRRAPAVRAPDAPPERSAGFSDPRLAWLTASFALATFVFGVVAVHLVGLLTGAGLTPAQAVTISMLVGPLQVAGRVIELAFASRVRAATVGLAAFSLMLVALVALISVQGMGLMAVLFVTAYGLGNGVLTIVRGTAPAELFGHRGLGSLLGYIARATFSAKAVAPAAFAGLLAAGLTRNAALGVITGFAVAAMASYWMAVGRSR
jgi:hypothetical protein